MRNIEVSVIRDAIKEMFMEMNFKPAEDIKNALEEGLLKENSSLGKNILGMIAENLELAEKERIPMCQDTGMAVVFLEVGQQVALLGGDIDEAVQHGIRDAYEKGYLRKSVVDDPFIRNNTNDNTPGIVYYKITGGDKVRIRALAKGFGSENMSRIKMMKPTQGIKEVIDFVVESVLIAGSDSCPPIIVGVGIGGTMEKAAMLAKEALMRPISSKNPKAHIAAMEEEILKRINNLDIGPQGLGGDTTALGVNVEVYPTHIAGLPVAVNINCHVSRHSERII